ncbi:MAG: hypothetical protein AB1758_31465 [Candidatus Eremiobacterota bacterium]
MHIQPVGPHVMPPLPRPAPPGGPDDRYEPGPAPSESLRPPSEKPVVGSTRSFWVWDMAVMPPGFKQVQATCRAVGPESYLFVDDAVWNRLATPQAVATLDRRLHRESPSGSVDPQKGVAALNNAYFGTPALGLDGDPKVYVLVTELASFNGTVLDGYVNPFDALPEREAWESYQQHSNEAEVVYLNAAARPIDSDYMQGVLAHEYQHLCHTARDPEEESWLSEMVAEAAMSVNGYHTDMGHVARHAAHPERPLVSQTYVDYGACMLFGTYLLERYGQGFFGPLVANPDKGTASIDSTLRQLGHSEGYADLYRDWVVANYADSRGVTRPGLHYATLDLPPMVEAHRVSTLPDRFASQLVPSGVEYLRLDNRESVRLRVTGGAGLELQLMSFDGPRLERAVVALDERGEAVLPAGCDRVLAVANAGPAAAAFELEFVQV